MTTFNSFDKKNLKALRDEMNEVLRKYGVDSNLDIDVGNMRFSEAEVSIKVTAKIKGAKTQADSALEMKVEMLGLSMQNSKGDRLVEYKPRNWKMPFIYMTPNGKRYKCDEFVAKKLFAA